MLRGNNRMPVMGLLVPSLGVLGFTLMLGVNSLCDDLCLVA